MQMPVVESMLSDLNSNLASGKRSLEEMFTSGDRTFKLRSGDVVEIPEEQVNLIWGVCDDSERIRLRLPIYVSTDTSAETGAWKVEGRVEASVVSKLLDKKMFRGDMIRLYYPDFKQLKSIIPDAMMVVFTP